MPASRRLLLTVAVLSLACAPLRPTPPVQAATSDQPLLILPILDGTVTPERVRDVTDRLGRGSGGVRVGFSGVYRYMAEVEPPDDRDEDTDIHFLPRIEGLERIASAAKAANVPFLVHLNGGRWAGGGPLVTRLMSDPRDMAWDRHDAPWSYPKDGEYFFSLGAYNELVRKYKKRNLQIAARWLADFASGPDGQLLVGVSTDSEVLINTHPGYDYNPLVLEEFTHWLSSDGVYAQTGGARWAGQGLGLSLRALNARWGTDFARWKDVRPPREPTGSAAWQDWLRFRAQLVEHNVQDQVDWIRDAGLTTVPIYPHQTPALDPDLTGDALTAANVDRSATGITAYGENAGSTDLFRQVRALGEPWGMVEYNPGSADEDAILRGLEAARANGVAMICPYHWDGLGGENEIGYTIRDTAFERALRRFVDGSMVGTDQRPVPQLTARPIRASQLTWSW